jgi:hypothetical protein
MEIIQANAAPVNIIFVLVRVHMSVDVNFSFKRVLIRRWRRLYIIGINRAQVVLRSRVIGKRFAFVDYIGHHTASKPGTQGQHFENAREFKLDAQVDV